MKKNRVGLITLTVLLLGLVIAPWANATICDDAGSNDYLPTVDVALLNAVLSLLGTIPVDMAFDQSINLLFDHTMTINVDSAINLGGVDFLVTPAVGSIVVALNLDAWAGDMTIEMTHAPCRDCAQEYSDCTSDCDDDYDECCTYWGCEIPCGIVWTACEAVCAGARVACEVVETACQAEGAGIDLLLDGTTAGLGFDSAVVEQEADVCVTEDCEAVHPLVGTDVTINGFDLLLFPEGDPHRKQDKPCIQVHN